jgi:branched-chain amino acid transport system ATP-binding protein
VVAADGVTFDVERREIVGLVGPNGSGKSTVFDLITGFQHAESGSIVFDSRVITGLRPHRISHLGVARTFQRLRPFPSMTLRENVLIPLIARSLPLATARERALEFLEFVGLRDRADELAGILSTGQRKRLEVARALATEPKLLMMDEPAAGVDPERLRELITLIQRLRERGLTLLIVEHNMRVMTSLADRLVVLDRGRKIAEGEPRSVVAQPVVIEAYLGRHTPTTTTSG